MLMSSSEPRGRMRCGATAAGSKAARATWAGALADAGAPGGAFAGWDERGAEGLAGGRAAGAGESACSRAEDGGMDMAASYAAGC